MRGEKPMKSRRTKACEIKPEIRQKVEERDGHCCIFCGKPGRGEAHFVARSHGGLGIEQNLITVCRWCHNQMDNGMARELYVRKAERYLREHYKDWNISDLVYHKGFEY